MLPANDFIQRRNQGYHLAGSRISLDSIAYAVRRGDNAEEILADFPSLTNRAILEGVIEFVRAHPREQNPPELVEKVRKYRLAKVLKSA